MVATNDRRDGAFDAGSPAESAASVADELAAVLDRYGSESGHFSLLGPDPWRILWNEDRSGVAAFLEAKHCVLSWRTPAARPEDVGELLVRLSAYARAVAKPLFVVPVNPTARDAGVRLGMRATWVGTECYLDLADWSLAGGRRQKVRWARSHAVGRGLVWREARPLDDAGDFIALARLEELWKSGRRERRTDSFLRTSFRELAPRRRYFVADGPAGVVASMTCTPLSATGWYLQDPVRAPDAPRGAVEGAMALALETLRDEGFADASNGSLMFWRPDGAEAAAPLGLISRRVLATFDHRYRFSQINQFRAKFLPDRTTPLYVLRSQRVVTPGAVRSLTRLLTRPPN